MNNFLEQNKNFWEGFQHQEFRGNLLIEMMPKQGYFKHYMCTRSLLLHKVFKVRPVFLHDENFDNAYIDSYVPNSTSVTMREEYPLYLFFILNFFAMFFAFAKAVYSKRIVYLKFDDIQYGDVTYDMYLKTYRLGVVNLKNPLTLLRFFKLYAKVAYYHSSIKKILQTKNITKVFSSHPFGMRGAPLVRCALSLNIDVFCPYNDGGVIRLTKNEHAKGFAFGIFPKDLDAILNLAGFDDIFSKTREEHLSGSLDPNAVYVYSDEHVHYNSRAQFCKQYGLSTEKKNIFVMLHVFIDQPHSHFNDMLFQDYCDWFLKTLDFAKKHDHVNWIFKRHPCDFVQPVLDVDFKQITNSLPTHVRFIDIDDKFDTRNLGIVADAVVTCMGSAGYEMAATYKIPVICAGDGPYHTLGFAQIPKTKEEYFSILKNIDSIEKLSEDKQKLAQAFYIFYHKYRNINFSAFPKMSYESNFHDNEKLYFDTISELYRAKEKTIKTEFILLALKMLQPDFIAHTANNHYSYQSIVIPVEERHYKEEVDSEKILTQIKTLLNTSEVIHCLLAFETAKIELAIPMQENSINLLCDFYRENFLITRIVTRYGLLQCIEIFKGETSISLLFFKSQGELAYNFSEQNYYQTCLWQELMCNQKRNADCRLKVERLSYTGTPLNIVSENYFTSECCI